MEHGGFPPILIDAAEIARRKGEGSRYRDKYGKIIEGDFVNQVTQKLVVSGFFLILGLMGIVFLYGIMEGCRSV